MPFAPPRAARVVGVLVALALALVAGDAALRAFRPTPADTLSTPSPALSPPATPDATAAPTGTAGPVVPSSAPAVTIASAAAVQLYVPDADPAKAINAPVQPLTGCRTVIDPPRQGPDVGGVFGCTDFDQPGTGSPGLAVLAGHSSTRLDTVFNRLYQAGSSLEGRLVSVRTADSGDRWLTYRVEHTYTPAKTELPYLTSVWGGDGSSTAGRLVLVTCQQNADGSDSTANFVAVAQLVGVS